MKQRILFIDRDGTLIQEPPDEQIDSLEKLEFLPGVISALAWIREYTDFRLVMVTNQDGLGSETFPENTFWPAHQKMLAVLSGEGVEFDEICIDRTRPEDNAPTRKPGTAMLTHYLRGDYALANSFVIGDRSSDVELAQNLGCKAILISDKHDKRAQLTTSSWADIRRHFKQLPRTGKSVRNTSETKIKIELNLDGNGQSHISTGIGFFDHMLEQISRHGNMDLNIHTEGDLHIDEHHTIEDTGLALGQALSDALGDRRGIERYGFLLPMDDARAQVALDFGGRPWCVWEAQFNREMIGKMPTEMFSHFFKSLSDTAKCNIHIVAEGQNEHHKIEAIFKAFARALRMAVQRTSQSTIPSTKGVL